MHTHIQTGMPKGGSLMEQDILKLPRKTLCKPASHSSVIQWFCFYDQEKVLPPFFSVLEKKKKEEEESKIKLRLCGKSIHWSSNDFQLCIITNLWPLEKHPLKRVVPIKCSLLQKKKKKKKVRIEQQKKVLSKREEGSVKGKGRAWWALCVPYLGLSVTMWCVAIRCVLSGFSGNSRGQSQLTHTHTHVHTEVYYWDHYICICKHAKTQFPT